MADPVGFTASVIGIATLAVQLGDALRKAAKFWEAVQDAPSDIRRLSKELRLVASVFHTIRLEYEAGSIPTNLESMVKDALELAKDDIDQLSEFISVLSRNLSVANGTLGRQWRKVQMALKASKIERFRDNLESVKATMALLQGSRQQASLIQVNSRLDVLTTNISSIATTNSTHQIALQTSQKMMQSKFVPLGGWKSSASSVSKSFNQYKTNFLLGTLNFRTISTTHRYSDDDETDNSTTTKTFLVELLMGFTTCRKGFRFMTTNTFDRYALDVIRRRPNDSEIFRLCESGNIQGVKKLLDRGEASIHDIDERGESLLHIALIYDDEQLCMTLLDLGADVYWKDDCGIVPISMTYSLTCFAAVSEAGFDVWSSYASRADPPIFHFSSISVWRYIFQHKPAQSIGKNLTSIMRICIEKEEDAGFVDFLVARFAEDLLQPGSLDSLFARYLAERMIFDLLKTWLESLFRLWFTAKDEFEVFLFEYKVGLILRRILIPSILRDSNKEMAIYTITKIYMDGVEEILKACRWSVEITSAIFQIWSKFFLELEVDLFSHHLYVIRENREGSDREASNKESTAYPAIRWHTIDCCRDTHFEIIHEDQRDKLSLNIISYIRPEYSHLDPQFTCEAGRIRCDLTGTGRCLSQIDEAFIKDGKFSMNIPGQWEESLLPNSAVELILHRPSCATPHICYSMIHDPESQDYNFVTEEDIQKFEENLRNGILYGLSEDLPETSNEE